MAENILERQPYEVIYQIFATIVANLGTLGHGCAVGWTSPSLPILRSAESPLSSGPLNDLDAAWIGSIPPLAGVLGTAIFGIFSNYVGSKRSLLWCALPGFLSWILLYLATVPWHLYVARFVGGIHGGAVFLCVSVYVPEIASDRIRGRLGALMLISFNVGIVSGYVAGSTLTLEVVPLVMLSLPISFFVIFIWFPQTPQFLLSQNRFEEAEKSLRFYRNCPTDALNNQQGELRVMEELQKLTFIAKERSEMPSIKFADFLTADAIRGMLIGPILMAACQFSGTFVLSSYAATIFMETGSTVDPNLSSIIMGSNQLMGVIFASSLIDRLGRKRLLLISSVGSAASLVVTGSYSYMATHGYDVTSFSVLPIISLSAFIFITAIGLTPVPYVIVSEVLPQKIRRVGVTVCVCSVSLFSFVMLRIFPTLLDNLQLYGCMWTFAAFSCFGFVFTLLVVRETNGINLDQIANKKNSDQ